MDLDMNKNLNKDIHVNYTSYPGALNWTDFSPSSDSGVPLNASNYTEFCDEDEYQDDDDALSSVYFKTLVYVLYIAIFVFAFIGNGIVCYIVQATPRMRTVTNYFIANLAIGDILMSVFCVPFSFVSIFILNYWPFGATLCHLVNYSQAVSVLVSAYTLVAISVDRYIAIMWPLKPRITKRYAKVTIGLVWAIALITAVPIPIVSKLAQPGAWHETCGRYVCREDWPSADQNYYYSLALLTLQFVIPLSVLVFTYTRIAIAVWGKRPPGEAENSRDQRMARSKRKNPLNESIPGQDIRHHSAQEGRQLDISRRGEKCETWKWTAPAPAGTTEMPHMWREAPLVPKLEKVNRCSLDQPNRFLKTISNTYPALDDRLKTITHDKLRQGNGENRTTTYHVDYCHLDQQPGGLYAKPDQIQDDNRFYSVRMNEPCNMFDATGYKVKCNLACSGGRKNGAVGETTSNPLRAPEGSQMQWRSPTAHWDTNSQFTRHPNLTQYMDTVGRTALIIQENKLHDHSQCRNEFSQVSERFHSSWCSYLSVLNGH